jgi:hypothetical protein
MGPLVRFAAFSPKIQTPLQLLFGAERKTRHSVRVLGVLGEVVTMAPLRREDAMPFIAKSGEAVPFDVDWNGIKSCPGFTIRDGQTFGEAARLSTCSCEFCRRLRSED